MSKMKRKWLRVIEYEETGNRLDDITRNSLLETHPDLPILQDERAMPPVEHDMEMQHQMQYSMPPSTSEVMMQRYQVTQAPMIQGPYHHVHQEPQIDSQLEQQIQREIASADVQR